MSCTPGGGHLVGERKVIIQYVDSDLHFEETQEGSGTECDGQLVGDDLRGRHRKVDACPCVSPPPSL